MKKIALISTFCDNDEKIQVLRENLIEFKKLGVDTMVLSPLQLPNDIIEVSDFVFFTKENPVLGWPIKTHTLWRRTPTKKGTLVIHNGIKDYGWAALYQFKKLFQISSTYDYDIYYQITYDLLINDFVKEVIQSNKINVIHPRQSPHNPAHIWNASLHFNIFDREHVKKIGDFIDYNRYINFNGKFAEYEAQIWSDTFGIEISKDYISDRIYYYDNVEPFNKSKSEKYKMFYTKPFNTNNGNIDLVFYNIKTDIKININDNIFDNIEEYVLYYSGVDCQKVYKFIVHTEDEEIDYTEQYNNTKERNVAYYE